jgi:hypothetical protein
MCFVKFGVFDHIEPVPRQRLASAAARAYTP